MTSEERDAIVQILDSTIAKIEAIKNNSDLSTIEANQQANKVLVDLVVDIRSQARLQTPTNKREYEVEIGEIGTKTIEGESTESKNESVERETAPVSNKVLIVQWVRLGGGSQHLIPPVVICIDSALNMSNNNAKLDANIDRDETIISKLKSALEANGCDVGIDSEGNLSLCDRIEVTERVWFFFKKTTKDLQSSDPERIKAIIQPLLPGYEIEIVSRGYLGE